MVAYSFQPMFYDALRVGLGLPWDRHEDPPEPKLHTIRAIGKRRHARPGERVQLYIRQRQPDGFLIGEGCCTRTRPILISFKTGNEHVWIPQMMPRDPRDRMEGDALERFARSDGFKDGWRAMREFWRIHHPEVVDVFTGKIIYWEPIK